MGGNPNVGKSTIFNNLTGLHQHTGNWPGKTVSNAAGITNFNKENFLLVDIPGTYSLMSNSEEEEIARDYICFGDADASIIVVDATCLERNLNLVYQTMEITNKLVVCVNLLDEAEKKGINIDLKLLEKTLGVPVVGTIARKKKTLNNLMKKVQEVCEGTLNPVPKPPIYPSIIEDSILKLQSEIEEMTSENKKYLSRWIALKLLDNDEKIISSIDKNIFSNTLKDNKNLNKELANCRDLLNKSNYEKDKFKDKIVSTILFTAENVCTDICTYKNCRYNQRDRKIDKILTSKTFGLPIMLLFLAIIFWLTIVGANYPSQLLSNFFGYLQCKLTLLLESISSPTWLTSILIDGAYSTLTWVIAVMLPPMAIFFPLFTIMEDLGYLPRIAFNLDKFFRKACSSRKTSTNYVVGEKPDATFANALIPCIVWN